MVKREAFIFLFVGSATVLTDLVVYNLLLLSMAIGTNVAKGIGFVAGLLLSYVANKNLTFGHTSHQPGSLGRYLTIYAVTLSINVVVNAAMLEILTNWSHAITSAFMIATGASAALNFLGMKYFVFRTG